MSKLYQSPLSRYYHNHVRAFRMSITDLRKTPWPTLMTLVVIGLVIALPLMLYVMLNNFAIVSHHWNQTPTLSVYLKPNLQPKHITELQHTYQALPEVATVKYISPTQGLNELLPKDHGQSVLTQLGQNPLPAVLLVAPRTTDETPQQLDVLRFKLSQSPDVDLIKIDLQWVERLYHIVQIGHRLIIALAMLFALGIIFIIGNTIRLAAQKHHQEIQLLKLIGARQSFIMRPLLYRGLIYGGLGSVFAIILVNILVFWLSAPFQALMMSYHAQTHIHGLNFSQSFFVMAIGCLLGLCSFWLTTRAHIKV